jgi:hypothetical protein
MKKHTGHIRHEDMVALHASKAVKGRDKLAHSTHHAANREAGMPEGLGPTDEQGGSCMQEGGVGMASNYKHE